MLHGHEDDVDDETENDAKVEERVCDEGAEPLFEPPPAATAVPLTEEVGTGEPTWTTGPLGTGL